MAGFASKNELLHDPSDVNARGDAIGCALAGVAVAWGLCSILESVRRGFHHRAARCGVHKWRGKIGVPAPCSAPVNAAAPCPPAGSPLWPCSLVKEGIRKEDFQGGAEGESGVAGTARRILHGPSLVWTLPAMSGEDHTEGGRGKYNAPPANPFAFTANTIPAALRFSPGASARRARRLGLQRRKPRPSGERVASTVQTRAGFLLSRVPRRPSPLGAATRKPRYR
jgi:hypothetical protein